MGNLCYGNKTHHARHLANVKERRRSSRGGKLTPDIMTYPPESDPIDEFVAKVPHDKTPMEIKDAPRRKRRVSCTPSIDAINEFEEQRKDSMRSQPSKLSTDSDPLKKYRRKISAGSEGLWNIELYIG